MEVEEEEEEEVAAVVMVVVLAVMLVVVVVVGRCAIMAGTTADVMWVPLLPRPHGPELCKQGHSSSTANCECSVQSTVLYSGLCAMI